MWPFHPIVTSARSAQDFMHLHAYASKKHGLRLRGLNTWSLCINPASTITRREVYKIIVPLGRTFVDLGYCDAQLERVVD